MTDHKRSNLIALAMLFFMAGIIGTRPLIPLLSNELGASTFEIGIIIAFFAFLPLFLAVKLGHLVDKFGALTPLIISAIAGGISLMLPLVLNNLAGVILSQLTGGIAQTTFAVAAQAFVSLHSNRSTRERNISILSVGIAGGGFAGPLLGGWFADLFGYPEAIALLGGGVFLAFFIVLYLYLAERKGGTLDNIKREPATNTEKEESVIRLLRNANLKKAMLISVLVLFAKDLYIYYFPLLAQGFGYSATVIGIIIGLHNGAGVIIRLVIIHIIERWGKSEVIVTSILLSGLLYGLLPFADMLIFSIIISALLGALLGVGQPLSITSAVNFSPENRTGEVLGLRLTFNRFTQFVSPVVFGGIASLFSLSLIFWIVAIILGVGSTKSFIREESKRYGR